MEFHVNTIIEIETKELIIFRYFHSRRKHLHHIFMCKTYTLFIHLKNQLVPRNIGTFLLTQREYLMLLDMQMIST